MSKLTKPSDALVGVFSQTNLTPVTPQRNWMNPNLNIITWLSSIGMSQYSPQLLYLAHRHQPKISSISYKEYERYHTSGLNPSLEWKDIEMDVISSLKKHFPNQNITVGEKVKIVLLYVTQVMLTYIQQRAEWVATHTSAKEVTNQHIEFVCLPHAR